MPKHGRAHWATLEGAAKLPLKRSRKFSCLFAAETSQTLVGHRTAVMREATKFREVSSAVDGSRSSLEEVKLVAGSLRVQWGGTAGLSASALGDACGIQAGGQRECVFFSRGVLKCG